jgi:hypothetical protein
MIKRQDSSSDRSRSAHLILVAAVIDGLRRETSAYIDEAARRQYERLSEDLRRCAFSAKISETA